MPIISLINQSGMHSRLNQSHNKMAGYGCIQPFKRYYLRNCKYIKVNAICIHASSTKNIEVFVRNKKNYYETSIPYAIIKVPFYFTCSYICPIHSFMNRVFACLRLENY